MENKTIEDKIETITITDKSSKEILGQAVISGNEEKSTVSQSNFYPDRKYWTSFDEVKQILESCAKMKYGENIEISYSPTQ
jgi:hypothetical protein